MAASLRQWLNEHYEQLRDDGPKRCAMHGAYTAFLGGWYTLTSRRPIGRNVYDSDWDLLIILDACRVDVLEAVADDYEFIESVGSRWSIGSHSHEWLTKTFTEEYSDEIANTAYISGNGHTHETFIEREYPPDETVPFCWPKWGTVGTEAFGQLDMLWETAHEDGIGVPPRAITDRTVEVARESDYDRLIAHYMQPHIPYIAGALAEDRAPTDVEAKGWKLLESGDTDYDEVWELYEENLRLVLDEVELLLENVDAEKVVVTADHGNAFGEYSVYGHPEGMPLSCVKTVPWIETEAVDEETFEPIINLTRPEDNEVEIQDHLEDLGYL